MRPSSFSRSSSSTRVARDELPPGAKQGSQAADADAHVVEALGIAAEPCARVVTLDLGQLVAQTAA